MSSTKRLFSAGSRQAPDPNDIFLEKNGFYRKHTARDSSSLFRVISEQMFDTQQHHLLIRELCVTYMRQNRSFFEKEVVHKNFDVYLNELSRTRTFGTLLELKALAYKYGRNVLLYEAQNNGVWLVGEPTFQNLFSVFFTPERHFDSIFTFDYVEKASFCQAICYEILYRNVYQLPDVLYAAEVMLHDPEKKTMREINCGINYNNALPYIKVQLDDGRAFYFDQPDHTYCILDNYLLCNFHNPKFLELKSRLEKELDDANDSYNTLRLSRMIDSLLPLKHLSCVRQLLDEGITPFPYKVAKSLDPDIYRNIEFDVWSDFRKEIRFRGLSHNTINLQVGLRCLVKFKSSQIESYSCYIQDMSLSNGLVGIYVEELAAKRMVPYQMLQPHPDNNKWAISSFKAYNRHRFIKHQTEAGRKKRSYKRFRESRMHADKNFSIKPNRSIKMSEFNSIHNYNPPAIEIIAMPMIRDTHQKPGTHSHNNNTANNDENTNKYNDKNNNVQPIKDELKNEIDYSGQDIDGGNYQSGHYGFHDQNMSFMYDPNIPPPLQTQSNHQLSVMNTSSPMYYSSNTYNSMYATSAPNGSQMYGHPYASQYSSNLNDSGFISGTACFIPGSNIQIQRRDLLQTTAEINFSLKPSYVPNGSDIQLTDLPSLRFYYNLGHEFFKNIKSQYGMNGISFLTQPDSLVDQVINNDYEVKQLSAEFQSSVKIEEIPTTPSVKPDMYAKRYSRGNNNHNNNTNGNMKKDNKNTPNNHRNKNNNKALVKDNTIDQQNIPINEYPSPNVGNTVALGSDRGVGTGLEPSISPEYYQYPVMSSYSQYGGPYQPQPFVAFYPENEVQQQYYYQTPYIPPPPPPPPPTTYGIPTGGNGDCNNIPETYSYNYGYPQPFIYSGMNRPHGYYYGYSAPTPGVIPITPAQMQSTSGGYNNSNNNSINSTSNLSM